MTKRTTAFSAALFSEALVLGSLASSAPVAAETVEEHEDENGDDTAEDGHAEDGDHGEGHHFNFYYGLLGEGDAEAEPTLWIRPEGMPVPFLALLINAAILFGGLFYLGRKGMQEALAQRRQRIVQGMEDAAKMRKQASEQLAMYEQKLKDIEAEVERVRREMQAAAEKERSNILAEAKARRERMERDAKQLIQQELEAAHEKLRKHTVRGAVESATRLLTERVTAEDRARIERDCLATVGQGLRTSGATHRGQA
jgi:F-type H+-transporting ATPase subunit b